MEDIVEVSQDRVQKEALVFSGSGSKGSSGSGFSGSGSKSSTSPSGKTGNFFQERVYPKTGI